MKIESVTVILIPSHTDHVIVTTDMPSPLWPFDGNLDLKFEAAAGTGEHFVRTHFGVVPKVIDTRYKEE